MTLDEKIYNSIQRLPDASRVELMDFIEYLLLKYERQEKRAWENFSLVSAMRDMEDEEALYTTNDLKVVFE